MARNLNIYKLDCTGKLSQEMWKDVVAKRDSGRLVEKRNMNYKLGRGKYKHKEDLDAIKDCVFLHDFSNGINITGYLEYITFGEITGEVIKEMYIRLYSKKASALESYLNSLVTLFSDDLSYKHLSSMDFEAFFKYPIEKYTIGILNKIKETMVEEN